MIQTTTLESTPTAPGEWPVLQAGLEADRVSEAAWERLVHGLKSERPGIDYEPAADLMDIMYCLRDGYGERPVSRELEDGKLTFFGMRGADNDTLQERIVLFEGTNGDRFARLEHRDEKATVFIEVLNGTATVLRRPKQGVDNRYAHVLTAGGDAYATEIVSAFKLNIHTAHVVHERSPAEQTVANKTVRNMIEDDQHFVPLFTARQAADVERYRQSAYAIVPNEGQSYTTANRVMLR